MLRGLTVGLATVMAATACLGQGSAQVVDAFGKFVGPFLQDDRVVVTLQGRAFRADITPSGDFVVEEPPYFYENADCSGTQYMTSSTFLPRAYVISPVGGVQQIVFPDQNPIVITAAGMTGQGNPTCRAAGPVPGPFRVAKPITVPVNGLGVTPPFSVQVR